MDDSSYLNPSSERPVICLALIVVVLCLGCCGLPQILFRVAYGRGPLATDIRQVQPGMTPEEVNALLGPPHKKHDDGEVWIYFEDSFAWSYLGVQFTREGVVKNWWSH